jgi:hypothetical protein
VTKILEFVDQIVCCEIHTARDWSARSFVPLVELV